MGLLAKATQRLQLDTFARLRSQNSCLGCGADVPRKEIPAHIPRPSLMDNNPDHFWEYTRVKYENTTELYKSGWVHFILEGINSQSTGAWVCPSCWSQEMEL
jgi:hypothetical protein